MRNLPTASAPLLSGGTSKSAQTSSRIPSPPTVKLLDFGVARLLGDDDGAFTRTGPGPLTPAYASPEQVLGLPVTTATDVYALGVILCELLTGRRPYDLAGMTAAQTERLVTRTDPSPPSVLAQVAAAGRALRGDLDAVVLKALAKEPERRYASAEALADDLRRHLDGLPVRARPATVRYRVGRFMRRHRVGVAMSAATAALIAVLSGVYAVQLGAERDHARAAAVEAAGQAERAQAVSDFLEQILRAPNASWYVDAEAKGPDTPIRAVLEEAARRVDTDFADRPDLRADLHHILGDTYLGLGMGSEAGRHHLQTLALRERLYKPPHPALAEALYYAAAYLDPDDVLSELDALERAAEMLRQRPEGNNLPFILQEIADFHLVLGEPNRALAAAHEGDVFVRETFVPGHPGYRYRTSILSGLSIDGSQAALDLGSSVNAEQWLVQGGADASHFPEAWGQVRAAEGRFGEAEPLLVAAVGAIRPFRPGARAVLEEYRPGRVTAALATLYEATGRTGLAQSERQRLLPHLASRDSLRRAYRQRRAR